MKKLIFYISILMLIVSPAWSANYFVSSSTGNDTTGDGSYTAPWASVTKVNSTTFSTGDDVYFKCDDAFTGVALGVDWSGTAENRVIIGSYYGSGTIGVSGTKPVIDGNHTAASSQYSGLIQITDRKYVTIENLQIVNAYGIGIRFNDSTATTVDPSTTGASYGEIKSCLIDYTGSSSIQFYGEDSTNGLIEDCTISRAGMGHIVAGGVWSDWPLAIGSYYADSLTIRNNLIYNCYTEGIGFYRGGHDGLAEENVLYNIRAVGIYVSSSKRCIIKHNMVYGTTDTTYHRYTGTVGVGIGVADEGIVTPQCDDNIFYGNLVAFCSSGFFWGTRGFQQTDSFVYNNTFVGNTQGISVSNNGSGWSNCSVRNNIFYQNTGGNYSGPITTTGLTWDYNLWSSSVIAGITGSHDVIGDPLLLKTTGWRSLTAGSLDESDFALQAGSPAIDVGQDLGDSYDDGLDVLLTDLSDTVTLLDRDNFGAGWDMGGSEYKGTVVVTDPTGLIQVGYSTETDVQTVGGTLTITLTDAVWNPDIDTDLDLVLAILGNIHGNLSTSTSWNALMTATLIHIVRVSDRVLIIEISPWALYDIDTTETITTTIPASCTNAGAAITCNTFYISAIQAVTISSGIGYSSTGPVLRYSADGGVLLYRGE